MSQDYILLYCTTHVPGLHYIVLYYILHRPCLYPICWEGLAPAQIETMTMLSIIRGPGHILHSVPRPSLRGIPKTMVCRIPVFMWSFGPRTMEVRSCRFLTLEFLGAGEQVHRKPLSWYVFKRIRICVCVCGYLSLSLSLYIHICKNYIYIDVCTYALTELFKGTPTCTGRALTLRVQVPK